MSGPGAILRIRSGNEQNRIKGILRVEEAPLLPGSTEDLVDLIAREYQDLRGLPALSDVSTETTDLAGSPAVWVSLTTPSGATGTYSHLFPASEYAVVALHGDRPFVISFTGSAGYEQTFRDILATFEFLD